MSEFEPRIFERVVEDPSFEITRTEVMVSMARLGMLRVFEPDETDSQTKDQPVVREVRSNVLKRNDSCKSNVHPSLGAADISAFRREIKEIKKGRG